MSASESDLHGQVNRRSTIRIRGAFPARLRGRSPRGTFDLAASADDVGGGGLFTRLPRRLDPGASVFVLVELPSGGTVAARGLVIRLEARNDGLWGVAVRFSRTRLVRSSV